MTENTPTIMIVNTVILTNSNKRDETTKKTADKNYIKAFLHSSFTVETFIKTHISSLSKINDFITATKDSSLASVFTDWPFTRQHKENSRSQDSTKNGCECTNLVKRSL